MSKFVFSTLPNAQAYTSHKPAGDIHIPDRTVVIKGGAGVADKRYETAPGVMTEISPEEHEFLEKNVVFQRHVKRGFIIVADKAEEVEKIAADQNRDSADRPLVDSDFEAEGVKPPTYTDDNASKKQSGKR